VTSPIQHTHDTHNREERAREGEIRWRRAVGIALGEQMIYGSHGQQIECKYGKKVVKINAR
jgi:hypothetical protein